MTNFASLLVTLYGRFANALSNKPFSPLFRCFSSKK